MISRYRRKLDNMRLAETNRLHKTLDDAGIKLGGLVSDINGKAARAMVDGLIDGLALCELIKLSGRLQAPKESLLASLEGDLSARHHLVLKEIREHLDELEHHLEKLDDYLQNAMAPSLGRPLAPATMRAQSNAKAARPAKAIRFSGIYNTRPQMAQFELSRYFARNTNVL